MVQRAGWGPSAAEECRRRAPFGYQRYGDHRRRRRPPHHQIRAWLHFISVARRRLPRFCVGFQPVLPLVTYATITETHMQVAYQIYVSLSNCYTPSPLSNNRHW